MAEPRRAGPEKELEAIEDADARDNYRVILQLPRRLLDAGTVEGCYMSLFKAPIDIPPMFVDQLVHVILRNILDGSDDPLRLRAAEVFFREQKATIQDGHVLLADLETVEMHAERQPLRQHRPADRRGAGRPRRRSTSTCSTAPTPRSTGSASRATTP